MLLYARPCEVDVKEEEQDAEADDGGLDTVSSQYTYAAEGHPRRTGRSCALGCCAVNAGTPSLSAPSRTLILEPTSIDPAHRTDEQERTSGKQTLTCGLIRTKSMNMTTKSCSTYLSQKLPHARHTVSRMLCPLAPAAPEYSVHSVSTGCRHSMQIGILLSLATSTRAGLVRGVW